MKKILFVDMDGVLADFEAGVRSFEPDMPWDRENVDRVCEANTRVFTILPEIEGGVEAVTLLKEKYDIYFLTTPMCNVPDSYGDKRIWLREKFGDWVDKRLILTHRKDLAKGDILIDDTLHNGVDNFEGDHIHFGTPLYPDWKSVLKHLL